MSVLFGTRSVDLPSEALAELTDSSGLLDDPPALRDRLAEDGCLLLRSLLPREDVLTARAALVAALEDGGWLTPGSDPDAAAAAPDAPEQVPLDGVAVADAIRRTVEHRALFAFMGRLLGEDVLTFPYKWLRAVSRGGYTGVHSDYVYMPRGSHRLHTTWIPFGDVPAEQGTLALCLGSHRLASFDALQQTYGRMDLDRDRIGGGGWFTSDPWEIPDRFGGQWATADMRAGDVIVFGMNTLHASTTNTTDRFRLSCDVRWQPSADPVDPRYVEAVPKHDWLGTGQPPVRTLAEARAAWGV